LLLDGKSIRNKKGMVKEKNRAKGRVTKGVFWREWEFTGVDFRNRRG